MPIFDDGIFDTLPRSMTPEQKQKLLEYVNRLKFKTPDLEIDFGKGYKEFSSLVKNIKPLDGETKRLDAFISIFSNDRKEIEKEFKDCFKPTDVKLFWANDHSEQLARTYALSHGYTIDLQTNLSSTLYNWKWLHSFCHSTIQGENWTVVDSTPSTPSLHLSFLWRVISTLYARSCKKTAFVFFDGRKLGKIFETVEKPELERNNVKIIFNPKDDTKADLPHDSRLYRSQFPRKVAKEGRRVPDFVPVAPGANVPVQNKPENVYYYDIIKNEKGEEIAEGMLPMIRVRGVSKLAEEEVWGAKLTKAKVRNCKTVLDAHGYETKVIKGPKKEVISYEDSGFLRRKSESIERAKDTIAKAIRPMSEHIKSGSRQREYLKNIDFKPKKSKDDSEKF